MDDKLDIVEAIELLEDAGYEVMNEDFSMGVGAPVGLDQGIPHGGDCKGCYAQRMGLYQRSPYSVNPFYNGVPSAHHPSYWLNQIPKKKKKKLRRRKKVNEGVIGDFLKRNQPVFDPIKKIYDYAVNLLVNATGNMEDKEKFTDAYNEARDYEHAVTSPVIGNTVKSDDIAHIFGRMIGHMSANASIHTNKDLAEAIKTVQASLRAALRSSK